MILGGQTEAGFNVLSVLKKGFAHTYNSHFYSFIIKGTDIRLGYKLKPKPEVQTLLTKHRNKSKCRISCLHLDSYHQHHLELQIIRFRYYHCYCVLSGLSSWFCFVFLFHCLSAFSFFVVIVIHFIGGGKLLCCVVRKPFFFRQLCYCPLDIIRSINQCYCSLSCHLQMKANIIKLPYF